MFDTRGVSLQVTQLQPWHWLVFPQSRFRGLCFITQLSSSVDTWCYAVENTLCSWLRPLLGWPLEMFVLYVSIAFLLMLMDLLTNWTVFFSKLCPQMSLKWHRWPCIMVLQLGVTGTCDTVRPTENVGGSDVTSVELPLHNHILRSGLYFRFTSTTRLLLLRLSILLSRVAPQFTPCWCSPAGSFRSGCS